MQFLTIWVNGCVAPGTLRRSKNTFSTSSSSLMSYIIPTTRCQSRPSESSPLACVKLRLASVQLQPAQSGSKQIHKSFVYTLTWAFPIRSWESSGRGDSQTLRVQLSGMERQSFFMCVYDTTTSIDGRAVQADKDQTMTNLFGVPLVSRDSLHRMTH